MTNEERILERLEAMEERLALMQQKSESTSYFFEQITPIGNHAFRLMIEELEHLNGRVTLDDMFDLIRKGLLNVPNLVWLVDQLENLTDLWRVLHPAIAPTFPHIVRGMGEWEKNGVFEKLSALKGAGGKVLENTTPEDLEKLGDVFVFLLSTLRRLSDPKLQKLITSALDCASNLDTSNAKPVSIFGILGALNDPNVKEALGLGMEVLKEVGKQAKS